MQPLKGLTVVTLEHAIAAPFATRQLADLGARVIKIERPGVGDFARGYDSRVRGLASHFVWTNRSKESLTLDVKHPEAAKVLERLVLDKADVVVQNLAPGAAARLGLGYERLSATEARRSSSATSRATARDGPYRDKKAYDLLIQSEAGFRLASPARRTSRARPAPRSPTSPPACTPTASILAALLQRGADRAAASTSTSRCSSAGRMDELPAVLRLRRRRRRRRAPAPRTPRSTPTARSRPGDGGTVMLGLQNEREWVNFCDKVLLQPGAGHATRASPATPSAWPSARRCAQIIVEAFAPLTAPQVVERLEAAQIANARVNTMHERVGAPAAEGARALARGGLAGRAAAGDAAAGHAGTKAAAHGPGAGARASTPTRSWPSWASTPQDIRALRAAEAI